MKIITVIPLKKSVRRDNLSYFTAQDIPLGSLVTVPVRKGEIDALVVDSREASNLKTELKVNDWQLRKLTKVKKNKFLDQAIITAANLTADFYGTSVGSIIKSTIPQIILDKLPETKIGSRPTTEAKLAEIIAIQEPDNERLAHYRSLIREAFARKQSVYLCLPSNADVLRLTASLSKGIANYVVVGHGQLSKRDQVAFWQKTMESAHPLLIIATPLFLSLPRPDIALIIIEKENSVAYQTFNHPFLDWRYFIENLAKLRGSRLILGDSALRTETIYRLGKNEVAVFTPIKYRLPTTANNQIIALIGSKKDDWLKALSDKLSDRLENAFDHKEKTFIYSGRRGLAPLTLCRDCGTIMACDICHSPLAIHQKSRSNLSDRQAIDRFFVCHKCGQIVEIEDECPRCRGQRLAIIGFGVEKIIEELSANLPDAPILRLDNDTAKTPKKAQEIIKQYKKLPSAILVGTEFALNYLAEPIDNIVVAEIDYLLALPDWRASEKLFSTLIRLKQLASKNFIIQTRQPTEKIFSYVSDGNLIDFYRDELAERRELGYPPFKVLIKISLAGKINEIRKEMIKLETLLANWQPLVYPSLTKDNKGQPIINLLLRLPSAKWPDPELLKILRILPPNFVVKVDPERIL